MVRSASSPVSTTSCTGACADGTSIGAIGCRSRSRSTAGKPASSVSSAAASRRRVPITLPTSSVFSGPTLRNHTACGLQSSTAATSIRSIGSSWTVHSPCCTSFSTKWRKRNFSVSAWVIRVLPITPIARTTRSYLPPVEIVDAVPAVVVHHRLELLEAHALVTQGKSAGAHVLEHGLHRLGRVHDGFEPEADSVEAELLEFLDRQDRSAAADQRIGELRHVEALGEAFELVDAFRRFHEDR